MTKREIVGLLASERRVERYVQNTAHAHRLSPDLQDLCQMVYVYLLDYDEDKIVDLWESGAIGYFVARIVLNQFRSSNSLYHRTIRRPAARATDPADLPDSPDPDTLPI